jgi:hypothetical protein
MQEDFDLYTGELEYKGISFIFVFNKKELYLIPPKDKKWAIISGDLSNPNSTKNKFIMKGVIELDEKYLTGYCNETGEKIVFVTSPESIVGLFGSLKQNCVLRIQINGYILYKYEKDKIDRINFCGPEINSIYPIGEAFNLNINNESIQNGIWTVKTKGFAETTTELQTFSAFGHSINAYFGISQEISYNVGEPPLILNSSLIFEFEPTNNYDFIFDLWTVARKFVQYLCYSQSITFTKIKLFAPSDDGKHEEFAELIVTSDQSVSDMENLKDGHFISQAYIAGHEGDILNDIASGQLYTRHLPENYQKRRCKNVADFILITAGFEWELKRVFPDIANKKDYYLSEKIEKAINRMKPVMGDFGRKLYGLNDEQFNSSSIGRRLAKQRNNFAHGNLDNDFIDVSLLDVTFMEYMIYGMQLKKYGITEENIKNCIHDLF